MGVRSLFMSLSGYVLALVLLWGNAPALAQNLYLVKGVATESGAPTTPQQAVELLEGAIIPTLEALAQHQTDGAILAGGVVVGARAVVFIVEAASNEEVTALVRNLPFWGLVEWQVTPLETFAHRATVERQQVEMLRSRQP